MAIIGAGPAGLLLSQLLHLQGIDSVVLERRDRAYVEARVRAGVLEHGTAETLREAGVGKRMDAEGMPHEGTELRFARPPPPHRLRRADRPSIIVYGQQEVVKDLIAARLDAGGDLRFEVDDVALHDLDTDRPRRVHDRRRGIDRVPTSSSAPTASTASAAASCPDLQVYERDYPVRLARHPRRGAAVARTS